MSLLESNKKVFLILFSIYFLVNIPMLLNFNGIYWDDWTLVDQSIETLNRFFFAKTLTAKKKKFFIIKTVITVFINCKTLCIFKNF